jgi:hypothetical protein
MSNSQPKRCKMALDAGDVARLYGETADRLRLRLSGVSVSRPTGQNLQFEGLR